MTDLDTDRLAAAKLWLISEETADLPYLAHALYALVPVATTDVATISADELWRVYVNPAWLAATDIKGVGAEFLHAAWHLLQEHATRARDLRVTTWTAKHWKTATDVAIEHTLTQARIPNDMSSAKGEGLPPGRSSEEYYAMLSGLPADSENAGDPNTELPMCGSACDGLTRSHELPAEADLGHVDPDTAQYLREQTAIAYQGHCTARGTDPGGLGRWAKHILEPEIPWEPLLTAAVRRAIGWTNGHTHYTYLKRSRRQSAVREILLPGTRRPVPAVAMVVDTSGSVDDVLLGRAMGEVDGALKALGIADAQLTVLACDAAVHAVNRIRDIRDTELAGGGGTDLRVGLRAASDLKPRPDLVVVFTDGYTPWPDTPPPGSAVVAAILGRRGDPLPPTPAWAKRVECVLA
ncbi:vWA domain-containing protein [Nocardioides kribbensis]|uniref:VWA-like domain-containing protein n=1 Tax=Nocardioides kribbensis TaxID=305517 RepID=A0ABV1NTD3_9ACTN